MKTQIEKCLSGTDLTVEESSIALDMILTGQATEAQIGGLLVALRAKGETVNELVGFAQILRDRGVRIKIDDPDAIDMCGTGGDGLGTFNISTVSSFIVAGAGVTVAKHGNRSVTSQSGSADVLTALGVNVQCSPETVQDCINRIGIGFLFAPMFHPAMKHVAKPRMELGVRSIFNMLGPLINPAGVSRQLIGAYHPIAMRLLAGALRELGAVKACIVHSDDGMDEVTLSGSTGILEVNGMGELSAYKVDPTDFGLPLSALDSIQGGDKEANATIALSILSGEASPARDVVVANAAMGLYVAGKAVTLPEGKDMAVESIDSGRAMEKLQYLITMTSAYEYT
jgi:anthranilate phosphoribosyltransferase